MNRRLAKICQAVGIEPTYVDASGISHDVPEETLASLASVIGTKPLAAAPPPTIDEVRAEPPTKRCFIPSELANARVWGITCQLASLVSARNFGIGDFADLAELCRTAAAEGADFVGCNPLHALFWSDPTRVSPFFPSNRRFLNPLYTALDWIDGYSGLSDQERAVPAELRHLPLVDLPRVAREKDRRLRKLFAQFPWTEETRSQFRAFCDAGGEDLLSHALFEGISQTMVARSNGATPPSWPAQLRQRGGAAVAAFAHEHRVAVDYHLWLQWLAHQQLGEVQRRARASGLRIGLYLDFAVGAAPDGSAAWNNPQITIPGLSIGAPPDPAFVYGQDWGLAPLSPMRLAALDSQPLAEIMTGAAFGGGAIRIDHAMGLARMWLIPRGASPAAGAFVRYPLRSILDRLSEISQTRRTLVVGEDLGTVPTGFRRLMSDRKIHGYKVVLLERTASGFANPNRWPRTALACFTTHDMPTFAGWWNGTDLEDHRALGFLTKAGLETARDRRGEEREMLRRRIGAEEGGVDPSVAIHAAIASSPCRLAVLQIEDALGVIEQANIPGTTTEHPNWRRRLPVALEDLADNPTFQAHTAAMRNARPK